MTVENIVRNVSTVLDKTEKVHTWLFFGQFRLFLESHLHDINVIAHIGTPEGVKWLENTSFESLRQFLKKIEKVHNWLFPGHFWLCFANPSHTLLMSCTHRTPT